MWNEIITDEDLTVFVNMFYNFHDSCIKEIKYTSGAYVNESLAMSPINKKRVLSVVIQRQFEETSMIEMEFSGLKHLILSPVDDGFTCEILNTTFSLKNNNFHWCDSDCFEVIDLVNFSGTLICASKLRWRKIDGCLGENDFFIPRA